MLAVSALPPTGHDRLQNAEDADAFHSVVFAKPPQNCHQKGVVAVTRRLQDQDSLLQGVPSRHKNNSGEKRPLHTNQSFKRKTSLLPQVRPKGTKKR